jgi:hypothetical protein
MRDLARRLLAESQSAADSDARKAVLVNEKLRNVLIQFAGADGFRSLLGRALDLASVEAPALKNASVGADGRLEGLEQLATLPGSVSGASAVAITAHLLELLVTFIGEPLTLRLVRKAWPNLSLGE